MLAVFYQSIPSNHRTLRLESPDKDDLAVGCIQECYTAQMIANSDHYLFAETRKLWTR